MPFFLRPPVDDYWDGVDDRKQMKKRAQVLKFPKQRGADERTRFGNVTEGDVP
jgi:hypothetical protein